MSIKEEKEARLRYLKRIYEIAKEADPISPTNIQFGLSKYGKIKDGKVVLDEQESGGYFIGEELGLDKQQVDSIVYHYVTIDKYLGSYLGMGQFYLKPEGIEYIENLEEQSMEFSANVINVGDVSGNFQIQQNTENSYQTQNISFSKNDFSEFYKVLKADIEQNIQNAEITEELLSELEYANRQVNKNRDIKQQLQDIGSVIKTVGIGVFTNLISSPIFEIFKPMLGL